MQDIFWSSNADRAGGLDRSKRARRIIDSCCVYGAMNTVSLGLNRAFRRPMITMGGQAELSVIEERGNLPNSYNDRTENIQEYEILLNAKHSHHLFPKLSRLGDIAGFRVYHQGSAIPLLVGQFFFRIDIWRC